MVDDLLHQAGHPQRPVREPREVIVDRVEGAGLANVAGLPARAVLDRRPGGEDVAPVPVDQEIVDAAEPEEDVRELELTGRRQLAIANRVEIRVDALGERVELRGLLG